MVASPVIFEQELAAWIVSTTALSDATRDDAKEQIRILVGGAIYNARRPRSTGPLAITIERIGGEPNYHLTNQATTVSLILDVSVWAKDTQQTKSPTLQALKVVDYLRRLLSAYRGSIGNVTVLQVEIENEPFEDAIEPRDASDKWLFRYVIPFQFWYQLATIPAV